MQYGVGLICNSSCLCWTLDHVDSSLDKHYWVYNNSQGTDAGAMPIHIFSDYNNERLR